MHTRLSFRFHPRHATLLGLLALASLPAPTAHAASPAYTLTILGTLPGGTSSAASAVNASG